MNTKKSLLAMLVCASALCFAGCYDCGEALCHANLTIRVPIGAAETSAMVEVCRGDVCYPAVEVTDLEGADLVEEDGPGAHLNLLQLDTGTELFLTTDYGTSEDEAGQTDPPVEEWTITVLTGSGAQISGSVLPEYVEHEINGDMCYPVCYNAVERID